MSTNSRRGGSVGHHQSRDSGIQNQNQTAFWSDPVTQSHTPASIPSHKVKPASTSVLFTHPPSDDDGERESPSSPTSAVPESGKPGTSAHSADSPDEAATLDHITYTWKNFNVWTDPPKPSIFARIRKYFKSDKPHQHHHHHGKHRRRRPHKHKTIEEEEVSLKTITSERWMLLNNVSGSITSGQLTGILGGSGSGKSLLLNMLSFRGSDSLHVNGDRILNGEEADYNSVSRVLAYVQQRDAFFGTLTVREHLSLQAQLRMNPKIPYETQMARVTDVINQFGLRKCENTVIGITGRVKGISGGEQKRLAFATEILTDPPMLFCDEPTSGLDSFMAITIVSALKDLAVKHGKAVMTTIHQPSTDCYSLFDNLMVLAEGRVAYFGPTAQALDFMVSAGHPSPAYFNPAEFLTCTLTIHPEEEEDSRECIDDVCNAFEASPQYEKLMELVESTIPSDSSSSSSDSSSASSIVVPCTGPSRYKTSWFKQFRIVYWRSMNAFLKDPIMLKIRAFQVFVMGLLIGLGFGKQHLDQKGIQNISGFMFVEITFLSFSFAFGVMDAFCQELPIVRREHSNGMYCPSAYFLAKLLTEIPVYIVCSMAITLLDFYMLGLHDLSLDAAENLTYFLLIGTLNMLVSVIFGYFVSCLCGQLKIAMIVLPALIFPFLLLGGLYMVGDSKVTFLNWVREISWYNPLYHNMLITQWAGVKGIVCNLANETCLADGTMTGDMVLKQANTYDDVFKENMWKVVGQVFLYLALAYVGLLMHMRKRE